MRVSTSTLNSVLDAPSLFQCPSPALSGTRTGGPALPPGRGSIVERLSRYTALIPNLASRFRFGFPLWFKLMWASVRDFKETGATCLGTRSCISFLIIPALHAAATPHFRHACLGRQTAQQRFSEAAGAASRGTERLALQGPAYWSLHRKPTPNAVSSPANQRTLACP